MAAFMASIAINTNLKHRDASDGGKKRCHGADGDDIVLKVPEGTGNYGKHSHVR